MIEIHKTDNILSEGFFNFAHSKEYLSKTDFTNISKIKGLGFYFKEDDIESTEFKHFFKSLNKLLLNEDAVYLVLIEIYPKKRNRVRSKRLMFYEERKELGEENILESEIEFIGNETIIIGAVKITEDNFDYCMDNLVDEYFSFGYIVCKKKDRFQNDVNQIFEKIIKDFSNSDKAFQINYLKLSNYILKEGSLIYRITLDGKSNQSLEIYGSDSDIEKLENRVENQLNKFYHLRRMWMVNSR